MPLQTAGERALFAELARWDTGGAVRSAVVASLPFSDGALGRRLSDAVLIVPEGVAVVRIVDVLRQSGVVTARPEGAWTIGPGAGPGEVLQLSGGGSTPLDGLMRAGMEAAVRLRRVGLEPGRIARLTVLVGQLTGLVPEDGDLGEGDQVALLEPRSLLLGIARASRYAGVDNPRLWTTADVRAALEALGLEGRGPSVEELNGEAFPYSPYVLRRPELLTPAAMTAASTAPPGAAPATAALSPVAAAVHAAAAAAAAAPAAQAATSAEPATSAQAATSAPASAVPAVPQPLGIPVAASSVTATAPAYTPAPSGDPFAGRPDRDTVAVAVGSQPEPTMEETGGLGGLFASAETEDPAASLPPTPPRTGVPPTPSKPGGSSATGSPPSRSGRRVGLLIGAVVLVLLLLAGGGFLLLRSAGSGSGGSVAVSSAPATSSTTPSGPQPGTTQVVGGVSYRLEAVNTDSSCVGHGYDQVGAFFTAQTDCIGLSRALYSATVDGLPMVAAVSHVRMPDNGSARKLKALADASGTGNVSDLLREGVTYSGAPAHLTAAEYASAVSGAVVTIVETSWVTPQPGASTSALNDAASSGLALTLPDPPGN
jgi:hypothetical protein